MLGHSRFVKIDPDFPSSLSRHTIQILREQGFEGLAITDALNMMGVVLKYGVVDPIGLSVAAGNDIPLPWTDNCLEEYNKIKECFERGLFTEEQLNACGVKPEQVRLSIGIEDPADIIADRDQALRA